MATAEFKTMIADIKREHPVLPEDKLCDMIRQYRINADPEIRNEIILSNIGLSLKFAQKFSFMTNALDTEDLFNETIEGITKAIDRFDPDRNVKFSTYASQWIMQVILRAIGNTGNTIRLPIHFGESIRKVKKYLNEFPENEIPDIETVIKETGEPREAVEYVLMSSGNIISLNNTVRREDSETELSEFIPSNEDLEEKIEQIQVRDAVHKTMEAKLTAREQDVINKRFGLNGETQQTLEEIGMEYGLSRERIRQIEEKALRKMKYSAYLRHML